MLTPKPSRRGKLLDQYVCGRIVSMNGIDIELFDFDRHNALYYFIMNADEQIYMRYGGRDAESADTYLNLESLELALEQGLRLHSDLGDRTSENARPTPPRYPRDIPMLMEQTIKQYNCVECHLIADYQIQELEQAGRLDKVTHMYKSPDIKTIGIQLDVPRGLIVGAVSGPAERAGLRPGDRIAGLGGTTVWTFGDLQYYYDKVPRAADSITLQASRAGDQVSIEIPLPPNWWRTNLAYRHWSVDPLVYFKARALPAEVKTENDLKPDGFASVVTYIHAVAEVLKRHELQVGDIVYAVDGVEHDEAADTCITYIKLRKKAGSTVMLSVLRDGQPISVRLKTERQSFRK